MMIDFRFTMKDPDWRVVVICAAFLLALILLFMNKADALISLAEEALRSLA